MPLRFRLCLLNELNASLERFLFHWRLGCLIDRVSGFSRDAATLCSLRVAASRRRFEGERGVFNRGLVT